MGLQMGDVAGRNEGAGGQQQGREAVDHRQQDPAVEAAGDAGHEAADDETDQRGYVEHAQILAGVSHQHFAGHGGAMGDQGQSDAGKQGACPTGLALSSRCREAMMASR